MESKEDTIIVAAPCPTGSISVSLPPKNAATLHAAESISEHYCSLHGHVIRRLYHLPGDFKRELGCGLIKSEP